MGRLGKDADDISATLDLVAAFRISTQLKDQMR
jgi:hypothetical protein